MDIAAAGSLHEFLVDLHGKFGPIASFYYGPKFTVSIMTPELFKEQLKVFDRPRKSTLITSINICHAASFPSLSTNYSDSSTSFH